MIKTIRRLLVGSAAFSVAAFGVPAAAGAASTHHSHHSHSARVLSHAAESSGSSTTGSAETALTGTTLSSVSAAAVAAVPGGTVDRATTEADGTGAYEVIVTKSDGTPVKVIEDSSFKVLSTTVTTCG